MTDETFDRVREHIDQHRPDRLALVITRDVPVDQPRLEPDRVFMHPRDAIDLRRRVERLERWQPA